MIKTRIRELRLQDNLSQAKLGAALNLTQQAVAKWEKGAAEPDIETLGKLSGYFNVTIDYLLGNSNCINITSNTQKEHLPLSQIERDALEVYNLLTELNDGNPLTQSQVQTLLTYFKDDADYFRFLMNKDKQAYRISI
ncbi:MAG: helix-turn-helix domain-containing protein [Defluviitaleaceae bacterium]|nr:helix-turn-helix domain-containing protein [Defluviitaleaceae bacterium]